MEKGREGRRVNTRAPVIVLIVSLAMLSLAVPRTSLNDTSDSNECRLWGITADSIPHDVVLDELINLPNSLKNLSVSNPDGWGLGFYNSTEPIVLRGQYEAKTDPNFDLAANEVADSGATIAVGHVRYASSGLVKIPDPHPFERYKNGRWWLFCHNGGIDKTILVNLIGAEYLAQNPPSVGSNQNEWIDSELYFIYILECCENTSWNVQEGIAKAEADICNNVPGTSETLNFLLTDGETLWGFRKGGTSYTLYYYNDSQYLAIASQYPTQSQGAWISVSDYYLVTLVRDNVPHVERICYGLTVGVSGHGITNATGTAIYGEDVNATVLATPDSGFKLDHWLLNGSSVGSANPYTVNMTANYNLTAVFARAQVTLTVEVSGHGVTNATGTVVCDQFSNVTVLATPESGYILSRWLLDGASVGSKNPYTVNMTDNHDLTAVFTSTEAAHLLLAVEPNHATYLRNQSVTLTVDVLNQLNPSLDSTLTLTVTGPGGYYYFDFQRVNVKANAVGDYSFTWDVPDVAGTYVVEVSLIPPQLTAYDAVWLRVD
jgi:predicted glutamine amidotransferase